MWGFPKIRGTVLGGPNTKDYSILGSLILGNYHVAWKALLDHPPCSLGLVACVFAGSLLGTRCWSLGWMFVWGLYCSGAVEWSGRSPFTGSLCIAGVLLILTVACDMLHDFNLEV